MKHRRSIIFWFFLGFAALVVGAATWLWTGDLGVLKPQIERFVSEQTGRPFTVRALSIDLDRQSVLVAEQMRLGNASWASEPNMLEIERFEIQVDLRSLIRGPVIVQMIDVDGARVFLQRPEDGEPNWLVGQAPSMTEEASTAEDTPFDVLFSEITVDDTAIVFESPERTGPIDVHIERFRQRHRADDFLDLGLDARIGNRTVNLESEVGSWQALLEGKDIRYSMDGGIDGFTIASEGNIDSVLAPRRPALTFSAAGPNINDLFSIARIDATGEGDIRLAGSLQSSGDEPLVLSVEGHVGRLDIKANGEFSDLQDLENIDVDLLASGPDLGRILKLFDIHTVGDGPFMVDLNAERRGSRVAVERAHMLFADAEFEFTTIIPKFPNIHDADTELRVSGPDIAAFRDAFNLPGTATGAFSIIGNLETSDHGIDIGDLDVNTSIGRLVARGSLGDGAGYTGTELEFRLEANSLARLAGDYGLPRLPDVPIVVSGAAALEEAGIRTHGPLLLEVSGIKASVDGLITMVRGLVGSRLDYTLNGPDVSALIGAIIDLPWIPRQPYDLEGVLDIRSDGFQFRHVSGQLASAAVTLDGLLRPVRGITGSQFEYTLDGPEIEDFLTDAVKIEVRPGPFRIAGNVGFREDALDLEDVLLEREFGSIELDLAIGHSAPRWIQFDIDADGSDVRDLLARFERVAAEEAPFSIDTDGVWQESRLTLDDLDVEIGDAVVDASGDLDLTADARSTRFRFNASIPSLARLGTYNGLRLRDQEATIDAIVRSSGGVLSIDDLRATLNNSDIGGSVRLEIGDIPHLSVDLSSDALALVPFFEESEADYDPAPTFDDGRLIPDWPVPLDALASLDATVSLTFGDLIRKGRHFRDVEFRASLQDGILDISRFGFQAPAGGLDARARIAPSGESAVVDIEVLADDFAPGLSRANVDLAVTGDLAVNLHATGSDLRSLAASADGIVFVDTRGGGFTNNRAMQAIYGDTLDEVVSTINPFSKSNPYTAFDCIILPLQIENGQLSSVPNTLVRTDKMRIVSTGKINLETEDLELNFRTTPRKGIVPSAGEILNPFVKVVGTLAAPRLAVDEKGVLVSGGAAVATGGLTILLRAAWNRLSRSKSPCDDVAKRAIAELGDRFPVFDYQDSNSIQ